MTLKDFGYNSIVEKHIKDYGLNKSDVGRVAAVFKDRYIVKTDSGETKAQITGNMQYSTENQSELPAVGDWVQLQNFDDDMALIIQVLPRNNYLERRAVGKPSNKQIIAANIDCGIIVESVTENYNINRVERYISICSAAKVLPVILLTKIDLIPEDELNTIIESLKSRINSVLILAISNITNIGVDELKSFLKPGKTYCLLGLSGVGKSTLINNLADKIVMKTKSISKSTQKGVHTTSHRQLFLLKNGSIIVDNPGMREVGLTDSSNSVEITFDKITKLAEDCRFSDCSHTHEKECAVLLAIENGEIDKATYDNFLKMKREQFHFKATIAEKRKRDKVFGKMVKDILKNKKSEKLI